jgi:hypothetical protein
MPTIAYATASHNPDDAPKAYDGDAASRWSTGVPMAPGMYYSLDLGARAMISGISARAADDTDNPASWKVKVCELGCEPPPVVVATGSGPIVATWPPVQGQRVIIECLSADPFYWWSISSLTVDAVDLPPYVEPPAPEPLPVEPPIDGGDVTVGPPSYTEAQARYWLEYWAGKFKWTLTHSDVVDFENGTIAVIDRVEYTSAKARDKGILTPWPFTDVDGNPI